MQLIGRGEKGSLKILHSMLVKDIVLRGGRAARIGESWWFLNHSTSFGNKGSSCQGSQANTED